MKKLLVLAMATMVGVSSMAQNLDVVKMPHLNNGAKVKSINIPNIEGYLTLKCDLHTHSCFSDGTVMPQMRVKELYLMGFDAMAMTDHLEYRPFEKYVKGDFNTSNTLAMESAKSLNIIVIPGTEITRDKPFGHFNALFVEDANLISDKSEEKSLAKALEQNAIIMWNHPGWPDNNSSISDIHKQLLKENKIDLVEVVNATEYYPIVGTYCDDYNLGYTANSDIHGTFGSDYGDIITPMTLVFAKERSAESLKEAMKARRTVAFCDNKLWGAETYIKALIKASLSIKRLGVKDGNHTLEIFNDSDISYTIKTGDEVVVLGAGEKRIVTLNPDSEISFINCFVRHDKNVVFSSLSEL